VAKAYIGKNEHGQPVVVNVHVHAAPTPSRVRPTRVDKITQDTVGEMAHAVGSVPPSRSKRNSAGKEGAGNSAKQKKRKALESKAKKKPPTQKRKSNAKKQKGGSKLVAKRSTACNLKPVVSVPPGKSKKTSAGKESAGNNAKQKKSKALERYAERKTLTPKKKSNAKKQKDVSKLVAKREYAKNAYAKRSAACNLKPVVSVPPSKSKRNSAGKEGAGNKAQQKKRKALACLAESKAKQKLPTPQRKSNTKKQKGVSKLVARPSNACNLKHATKARKSKRQQPLALPKYLSSIGKKKARDIVKVEINKALAEQRRMTKDIEKAALAKKLSEQRVRAARQRLSRLQ